MKGLAPVGGFVVWLVLVALSIPGLAQLTLVDLLFLLAPLVVVPLGLELLPYRRPALKLAVAVQGPAALAVVISILLPAGVAAGALALAWLVPTGLVGLLGLSLLVNRRSLGPDVLVPSAAMGFLAVGAVWLVISRSGIRPLGFSPQIVELTAVHFHYAGFAATLMAALTLARVPHRSLARTTASAGSYLMIIGTPIVALGITLSAKLMAFAGAGLLATGVITLAVVTFLSVVPGAPSPARFLLAASALSVLLPMVLAVLYTARPIFNSPALGLKDMAATHGVLNSLAFSTLGLVGWRLMGVRAPSGDQYA
jgi:hypothetical protein